MDGSVEAVACDMNSDFQEAFEEKCPHIQPVFDYFHIVKNFNDKVVSEVRKDEQRRLYEEGNVEAARALKKTRYIPDSLPEKRFNPRMPMPEKNVRFTKGAVCSKLTVLSVRKDTRNAMTHCFRRTSCYLLWT